MIDGQDIGFWDVSDTTLWAAGISYGNIGSIQFTDGVVASVGRTWKAPTNNAASAVSAAVGLIDQLDGQASCSIQSRRSSEPDVQFNMVEIGCGEHFITVSTSMENGHMFYQLSESWRRPKAPHTTSP